MVTEKSKEQKNAMMVIMEMVEFFNIHIIYLGDGCSKVCKMEKGFNCEGQLGKQSLCSPICGDGLILGTEQCDDGNTANSLMSFLQHLFNR